MSVPVHLLEAFSVDTPELVTLVGGGGKTTLMYALIREAKARGLKAAAATTTKLFEPKSSDGVELCLVNGKEDFPRILGGAVPPLFASGRIPGGKVSGLTPELIDELYGEGGYDLIVVEGDGSRRMPLKAPGDGEPVVPFMTSLFIAVVGLSALGATLDEDNVFRPHLAAKATGAKVGDTITTEMVSALLNAPEGLKKGLPAYARGLVALNQCDTDEEFRKADELAKKILSGSSEWEGVAILKLAGGRPVKKVVHR
ncbi:MAG: putative selenium-dependent hydroxylase accessory protein YqeC [Deltaproteobacteria bacterium]|nr:MAG: putative selenium-dependent hydroxylase accessory protein YqeC [Deltaproteobacteria bacterium]